MTTIIDAREAIYQRFETAWGTTSAFFFDNEQDAPPVDAPWVRVVVRHNLGFQETLGGAPNRRFLRGGILFIQVFTPLNTGLRQADVLAHAARQIFDGVTVAGPEGPLWFVDGVIRDIGPSAGWHQVNIEFTFSYEEIQ